CPPAMRLPSYTAHNSPTGGVAACRRAPPQTRDRYSGSSANGTYVAAASSATLMHSVSAASPPRRNATLTERRTVELRQQRGQAVEDRVRAEQPVVRPAA